MTAIAVPILAILVSAGSVSTGSAAPVENTQLTKLVTQGVAMPDGQIVKLPAPKMAEGLTAAQQMEVLKQVTTQDKALKGNVKLFLDTKSEAPVSLKVATTSSNRGSDLIRKIDVYFVVHGDWNVLTSKSFSDSILKADKAKNNNAGGWAILKAGTLTPTEMAVRKLTARSTSELKEYYLYTTIRLSGEVQISATRLGVATKTPTGVVVAAKTLPQFASDKEYPNQWQAIVGDALGNPVLNPAQPYSGAGFYAKVTRLSEPANAIFVEYHSALYEPAGWFGAENERKLPADLNKIVPHLVKQFRIKLADATEAAAQEKAADAKPADGKPVAASVAK